MSLYCVTFVVSSIGEKSTCIYKKCLKLKEEKVLSLVIDCVENRVTVTSSSLAPADNAALFRSSVLSADNTRCNNEKISGASGLD